MLLIGFAGIGVCELSEIAAHQRHTAAGELELE
jgi:hypothetical protein